MGRKIKGYGKEDKGLWEGRKSAMGRTIKGYGRKIKG